MYRLKKVAVIIPAHNEEALIGRTLDSVPDFVDQIIVVDDGSNDKTPDILEKYKERDSERIDIIHHSKNMGVGASILDGYRRAYRNGADLFVVIAGDAQMDTRYMPALLDPLVDNKADYTKGNRLMSNELEQMPLIRRFGNALLTVLTKFASGYWSIIDPQNGYTGANRRTIEVLLKTGFYHSYGYCNDILIKLNAYNMRVYDVVMPPVYRDEVSEIQLRTYTKKLSLLLMKGFVWRLWNKYGRINLNPILFFYMVGFVLSITGLLMGTAASYWKWYQQMDITAGTSNLIMLVMVLGIQMLMFAFLFDEMQSRNLQAIIWARPIRRDRMDDIDVELSKETPLNTVKNSQEPMVIYQLPALAGMEIPTLRGIFKRIKDEYWGIHLHPVVPIYLMGFALFFLGIIFGAISVYSRYVLGTYTVPTLILSSLLIILGAQTMFFGLIFEAEIYRIKKANTKNLSNSDGVSKKKKDPELPEK